jgi:hypothetical protein
MKSIIIILLILLIFYFLFRGELFTNHYSSIKLFDSSNWATYCSCDGKHLDYTFRRKVNKVIVNLREGDSFTLYGYTGAGLCESEMHTRLSIDWKPLIAKKNTCSETIYLDETFKCYHILLNFA